MRILVAEDDAALCSLVKKGLEAERYAVDVAREGYEAQYMAEHRDYDLLLLDLTLPRLDGLKVLESVRAKKPSLPVLVLTGRTAVEDRVKGLNLGADDYLIKPFSYTELSARVRALLRRGSLPAAITLRVADLEMDRVDHQVRRAGKRVDLTAKEFNLLEYLMLNHGHAVSRAMIVEHVWNLSFDSMTNVVDVYINYLRNKVDEGFEQKLIHTVRGVGYRMSADDEASK